MLLLIIHSLITSEGNCHLSPTDWSRKVCSHSFVLPFCSSSQLRWLMFLLTDEQLGSLSANEVKAGTITLIRTTNSFQFILTIWMLDLRETSLNLMPLLRANMSLALIVKIPKSCISLVYVLVDESQITIILCYQIHIFFFKGNPVKIFRILNLSWLLNN